jgi:hypothetical protein
MDDDLRSKRRKIRDESTEIAVTREVGGHMWSLALSCPSSLPLPFSHPGFSMSAA